MFYEFSRINNLKKQCQVALHNATQLSVGAYPNAEQFLKHCKFSFIRNIVAVDLLKLCGEDLIADLNECSEQQMMLLILSYIEDTNQSYICPQTVLKDMVQAARPAN